MIETRFKKTEIGEIPEDWELKTLGSVCRVNGRIGFRGYTTADLVKVGAGAYTIGGKHITNNYLDLEDPEFISWDKYYESPEIMVEKGDIVLAQRGSLGKSTIIDREIGPATINPSLVLLKRINCDNYYLNYFLHSKIALRYIFLCNGITSIPMISQKQIEEMPLVIPSSSNEQQRIATALSDIDTLLSALNKKIKKKKLIKQGVMRQLLTGKKRIAGFTEPWEEKTLGEVCTIITGGELNQSNYSPVSTDKFRYPIYANGRDIYGYTDHYIIDQDCACISSIGANTGDVFLHKAYFTPIIRLKVLIPKNCISIFIYYYLSALGKFTRKNEGGIANINANDVKETHVAIPSKAEQTAIATILSDMDKEIEKLEAKRAKYEQIKQGMMQQLLTGKIRLVSEV